MNERLPESLSEQKVKEIKTITDVIIDFLDPDMIILYGSYAKGEFKDHVYIKDGIRCFYISDYDLIILTSKTDVKEYQLAEELEKRIHARPDINFFMYDIDFLNKELLSGNYFFVPVYHQGVVLYDNKKSKLVTPKPLTIEQIRENAQGYYDFWMDNSREFYETSLGKLEKSRQRETRNGLTLWFLFQTIESLYSAILLVFMGIKPKLHNLRKYRKSVNAISKELNAIFPDSKDREERRLFDLLNRAYIGGKYKMDFEVELNDLEVISQRLAGMITIVDELCQTRIQELK